MPAPDVEPAVEHKIVSKRAGTYMFADDVIVEAQGGGVDDLAWISDKWLEENCILREPDATRAAAWRLCTHNRVVGGGIFDAFGAFWVALFDVADKLFGRAFDGPDAFNAGDIVNEADDAVADEFIIGEIEDVDDALVGDDTHFKLVVAGVNDGLDISSEVVIIDTDKMFFGNIVGASMG